MYSLTCTMNARPEHSVWDLVSGLLYQFHSQGIEEGEEPAPEGANALHAANEFEHALEPGLLAPPDRFIAYFENRRDAEHAMRAVEAVLARLAPKFEIAEVVDKDYSQIWRDNFQPLDVPPFWRVRASWHDSDTSKKIKEIIIEPGMAFGTGSHETTRACLELMAEASQAAKPGTLAKVLDFGCGSGILAVGLKKLGIGEVHAIDIDPLAIDATHQNAERNGVTVEAGQSLREGLVFDGIVANILKNTLLDFAPKFKTWLKPQGFLILSGLLGEQEDEITAHYHALGFKSRKRILNNNWVSLWLTLG